MTDDLPSHSVFLENCPPHGKTAVTEADVLITHALAARPARQSDLVAENQALHTLAQQLTDEPRSMLKTLVWIAKDLCRADAVGVGFLESSSHTPSVFRWVAIAGTFESLEQTTALADFSPCETALCCRQPQLYAYPERYFTYLHHPQFPIVEGLLFPLCINDQQLGTFWILSHDVKRQFDREDQRLGNSLAGFAAIALQNMHQRQIVQDAMQREQALRREAETAKQSVETILSTTNHGFCRLDLNWRYTYVNDRYCEIVGMQSEEMLGNSILELMPDTVGTNLYVLFRRALAKGTPPPFEYFYPTWNRWYEFRVNLSLSGATILVAEITDRKQAEIALRDSEAQFRYMADNAPFMVWVTDATGYCTYLSQSWYDFTGQTEESGLGFGWLDHTHPDDREATEQIFLDANQRQAAFRLEYRLRDKNGNYRWAIDAANPWFSVDGEFKGYIGSVIDIDDRKRAESALRRSEERYRTLFESIDEGFCVIEVLFDETDTPIDYRFLEVNPAFENQTGLQQIEGKRILEIVPTHEKYWFEIYGKIVQTGEPLRFENRAEGLGRWYEVYGFRLGLARERKVAVLFKDVSDRKRIEGEREAAERALQSSEEQSRNILESISDAFFALDAEWRFTYLNQQAERLLAQTRGELIGQTLWEAYPGLIGSEFEQAYRQAARERIATTVTSFYADHDRWYEVHVYPATTGITIYFRNVTDRQRIAAEREQLLQREQCAREAAENANRIKDEFLAVLSHELRSPLNPILGWAKLLQQGKLDAPRTANALATIERNAALQAQLVDDLLDISRILQGKLTLNTFPLHLSFVISAAIDTVRLAVDAKAIQLQLSLDPDVGQVLGDTARLQQVVWNLLSNAAKFTPPGGQITVTLTQVKTYAQIQIKDTGKGIHPDFLPYVFEHFRQEDGAINRKFGGLGLGLAIVRQIVEMHGGTVQAESPGEGLGATFTVRLPLTTIAQPQTQATHSDAPAIDLAGVQILVVDDESDMRELAEFVLEQHGAKVLTVSSAQAALTIFDRFTPDILISDIGMPDMDGYMLMRQVRNRTAIKQIPAIALTAYAGELDQQQAIAAGFQQHVSKPVDPDELVRTIMQLLQETTD